VDSGGLGPNRHTLRQQPGPRWRSVAVLHYVRIYALGDGASKFEDVEVEGDPRHVVDGVPPLLLSGPYNVTNLVFVEQPANAADWEAHVAPRRQWLIVMVGRVAVTVSDGERREFGPGDVLFADDIRGEGHVSTPLTPDFKFAMIPAAD
jgi:hypothetical protein